MKKQVAVMMPFGGEDEENRRRAILNYQRLEHVITQEIEVESTLGSGDGERVTYEVAPVLVAGELLPPAVMDSLRNADIVVGLITENSPNVTWEVAVRSVLRDEWILVVGDKSSLPLYLRDHAYVQFFQDRGGAGNAQGGNQEATDEDLVRNHIETLAGSNSPVLTFPGNEPIAPELAGMIHRADRRFIGKLELAFATIADGRAKRPKFVWDVMRKLEPSELAHSWIQYYPSSIVKAEWSGKSGDQDAYTEEDLLGHPHVCSWNDQFLRLYNMARAPNDLRDLTQPFLLEKLRDRVDDADLEEYDQDQKRLVEEIILENKIAYAEVPIRFNQHEGEFSGCHIKPILIGRTHVGNEDGNHTMYLHVIYIKEPRI